jgi:hypothetical protein
MKIYQKYVLIEIKTPVTKQADRHETSAKAEKSEGTFAVDFVIK